MKNLILAATFTLFAFCALAQTNAPFTPPPTIVTPPVTSQVVVAQTVTNLVPQVVTNRVTVPVVSTNAVIRRFVVDIDTNQSPLQFTCMMSDHSMILTPALAVHSLTNRVALSAFNALLADIVASGHRFVPTNGPSLRGTNLFWRTSTNLAVRR